jgi:drug/metabolite transporter (DMT)-like permease
MRRIAVLYALISAALFGLATPLAKLLIGDVVPEMLAAIFYLAAGLGLGLFRATIPHRETPLTRRDLPWLAGAILAGGVGGPTLMMLGLARAQASMASLLLTLEGVATALLAWFVFRENFDRQVAAGLVCIVAGAAVLSWQGDPLGGGVSGPVLIVGACICWGIDNNLTRKIANADPVQIAMLKGLCGGPVMLAIALASDGTIPPAQTVALAALVGFFGIGVSLALFVRALRDLGAARTGAYFSTAPFLGAAAAIVLIDEPVTWRFLFAGALMAFGVYLHLTERHSHEHEHEPLEHAHRHVHDAHHRHAHSLADPPGEPHSHRHTHVRLRHSHAHAPDSHHIHRH